MISLEIKHVFKIGHLRNHIVPTIMNCVWERNSSFKRLRFEVQMRPKPTCKIGLKERSFRRSTP